MKPIPYQPEIRFSDIDAMGHVNNAVYFSYLEQARIHFFRALVGIEWNWRDQGILVAHNEIDYKAPILLNDLIHIDVYPTHIGNRSFTLEYRLERIHPVPATCSRARSILVCFNYENRQTIPLPDAWRRAFEGVQQLPSAT